MEEDVKKEEIPEDQGEKKEEPSKPPDKMTAKELREIALEIPGITGVHAMKKEDLLKAIKEAKGIKDEAPVKKKKTKAPKSEMSVKQLKEKITLLKKEKDAARTEKERKRVDILRRRISRLKKGTRKVAHT